MVVSCSACGEQYGVTEDVTFHKFPANEERRKKWLNAVQRDAWTPAKRSMLCSKHFSPDKFVYKISGDKIRRYLMPDTIPTIFDRTNRKLKNGAPQRSDEMNEASTSNLNSPSDLETVELKFVKPGADTPFFSTTGNSTSSLNLDILAATSIALQVATEPELIELKEDIPSEVPKSAEIPVTTPIPISGTSSNKLDLKPRNQHIRIINFPKAAQRPYHGKLMQPDLSSLPKRVRQVYPGDFKELNYNDVIEVSRSWTVLNNYIKKMRRNMKALQQRNRRLEKRVTDLKSVVNFLKNRLVERDSADVRLCGHSNLPVATTALYEEDIFQQVVPNPLQDHNYISAKDISNS